MSDENFNGAVVRGLLRRNPDLQLVRVQDVGLRQTPDPDIVEWAAGQERVLLSHDVSTVRPAAYQRVAEGEPMPGVYIVSDRMPIGQAGFAQERGPGANSPRSWLAVANSPGAASSGYPPP